MLYIIYALLINILCVIVITIKFMKVLEYLNEKISFINTMMVVTTGQILSYLTPLGIGAIAVRSFSGKLLANISPKKTILATVFDQIFELVIQILLFIALLGVGAAKIFNIKLHYSIIFFIILIPLLSIIIYSFYRPEIMINLIFKLEFLLPKFVKKKINKEKILEMAMQLREYNLLENKKLITLFFIYLIFIILYPLILKLLLVEFNIKITYLQSFLIVWFSYVLGRLSGIPGGFGTRDITIGALLSVYSVPITTTVKAVLLYRIIAMAPSVIIGFIAFIYRKFNKYYLKP